MITSPALLLDKNICTFNITRMAQKARKHGLTLKPHFKTHQSAIVGGWFREENVEAITVSSIEMAEMFADEGWNDITIALPVNIREIDKINRLAQRVDLRLFVLDSGIAQFLNKKLERPVHVYIEVDTGAGRTGLPVTAPETIQNLADEIEVLDKLELYGFYSHPGHSYGARGTDEIERVHENVLEKLRYLKSKLTPQVSELPFCAGDTPCSSVAEHFDGLSELSPGNFVFYDLMQHQIGACRISDIAVALAAPVVAKYPDRSEIVVHGGAVHLSKESLAESDGRKIYGKVVALKEDYTWSDPEPGNYVRALSQEHGILKCSGDLFAMTEPGDLLGIIPVHSCLTANLMREYKIVG